MYDVTAAMLNIIGAVAQVESTGSRTATKKKLYFGREVGSPGKMTRYFEGSD